MKEALVIQVKDEIDALENKKVYLEKAAETLGEGVSFGLYDEIRKIENSIKETKYDIESLKDDLKQLEEELKK